MTEIYMNYEGIQYQSALTSNHLVKHRLIAIQLIQQQQTPIEYINPFETSLRSKYDLLWSKSVKNPSRGKFATFSARQILDLDILPSTTTSNTTQKHRYINAINPSNNNFHQLSTMPSVSTNSRPTKPIRRKITRGGQGGRGGGKARDNNDSFDEVDEAIPTFSGSMRKGRGLKSAAELAAQRAKKNKEGAEKQTLKQASSTAKEKEKAEKKAKADGLAAIRARTKVAKEEEKLLATAQKMEAAKAKLRS
jgi:hypothetical protein